MPEITVTGANSLTFPNLGTWGWEIAIYLFLGGLVAGMMIFTSAMRLTSPGRFARALLVGDLASLPLLGMGMLLLLLDLANRINVWRFYTTFQVTSAMSWGAWILFITMVVLALRFVSRVPAPPPSRRPTTSEGDTEKEDAPDCHPERSEGSRSADEILRNAQNDNPVILRPRSSVLHRAWRLLYSIGQWARAGDTALTLAGLVLGAGVGFYTGMLLSTIPSRPLWNTAVLAPLFLVSGLGTGGAFLCLFLPEEEHHRLVPFSVLLCGIEIALLLAYAINLTFGNSAAQRSGSILFGGSFGIAFWGLVVLVGLLIPAVVEQLELMHRRVPLVPVRLPPVLKLTGGLALRLVIVYAGLLSFV